VADIQPGPLGSRPQLATSLGSKLVFFADDGVHGLEPWVWDGTEAKLLVDLVPGSEGVVALRAQAVSGRVFFVVALPDGSRRLFRSDGTSAATVELLALSGNTWLDSVGGTLLFDNATAAHGLELWAWWPGLAAPREVVDLMPGPASSSPRPGEAADTLYVYAAMDPTVGVEPMGLTVDVTAPVITAMVTGTLADSGFYSSDVKVHFDVVDPEAQLTQSGCDDLSITADTAGTTVQCFAESAGGATTGSIRIKRDATAPVLGCPAVALWADGGLALEVTATDTIDPKPTVTFEPPPETWSALTTAVKVSARDATGNLSTCEVTVRLPDEPTLQRPQAMSCTTTDIRWSFLALASLLMFRRRWKFTGW
jgi:ELWxxDGT repeat protein